MNNIINTSSHVLLKPIEEQLHSNKIQQNKNKNIEGFFRPMPISEFRLIKYTGFIYR